MLGNLVNIYIFEELFLKTFLRTGKILSGTLILYKQFTHSYIVSSSPI